MLKKKISWVVDKLGKKRLVVLSIILMALIVALFISLQNESQQKQTDVDIPAGQKALVEQDFDTAINIYSDQYETGSNPKTKGDSALNVAQGYIGKKDNQKAKEWLEKSLKSYEQIADDENKDYYIQVVKSDLEFLQSLENIPEDNRQGIEENAL